MDNNNNNNNKNNQQNPTPSSVTTEPPIIGSWASVARNMAEVYPDFDWDAWKDEMKEVGSSFGE